MNTRFNEYKGRIDLTALIDGCREKGKLFHYAKGDTFVREGEVGRYFGVVESGYFKYITITTEGDEAVVGFAFGGVAQMCSQSSLLRVNELFENQSFFSSAN